MSVIWPICTGATSCTSHGGLQCRATFPVTPIRRRFISQPRCPAVSDVLALKGCGSLPGVAHHRRSLRPRLRWRNLAVTSTQQVRPGNEDTGRFTLITVRCPPTMLWVTQNRPSSSLATADPGFRGRRLRAAPTSGDAYVALVSPRPPHVGHVLSYLIVLPLRSVVHSVIVPLPLHVPHVRHLRGTGGFLVIASPVMPW
jgi:hypothetical protein